MVRAVKVVRAVAVDVVREGLRAKVDVAVDVVKEGLRAKVGVVPDVVVLRRLSNSWIVP